MLARGKRRQDEEESLVPHGAIWQATENSMSPQPEIANSAAQQEAVKATPMPAPSSSARSDANRKTRKPKLGAISPPLPWPSPKIQEIARPVRPRFSALPPEVKSPPSISASVPNVYPIAAPTACDTTGESVSRLSFWARFRAQREAASLVFSRCRQHAVEGLLSTKAAVGKLQARVEDAYQLSIRRLHDVARIARDRRGAAQADQAPPVEMQESRAARGRAFASIRGAAEHATSYTRLKCERALLATRNFINNAAEATREFRIKIKFRRPQSAALQGLMARAKHAKSYLLRRESRLSTSVVMGALCALLALLVFSGVRGYAPHASPAKVSANRPATPTKQAVAIAVTKPSPAARSTSSKPNRSVVKRASLSTPARKVASPKVTRKKNHHNEDEDYVAKDTYVYYGLNGKSRR